MKSPSEPSIAGVTISLLAGLLDIELISVLFAIFPLIHKANDKGLRYAGEGTDGRVLFTFFLVRMVETFLELVNAAMTISLLAGLLDIELIGVLFAIRILQVLQDKGLGYGGEGKDCWILSRHVKISHLATP
jgi:hypothetical protein